MRITTARRVRGLVAGVGVAVMAGALALSAPASADTTVEDRYAPLVNCPVEHPLMSDPAFWEGVRGYQESYCVAAVTHGGSFRINETTTEITQPVTVSFGVGGASDIPPTMKTVTGPNGLVAAPEAVAGGLLDLETSLSPDGGAKGTGLSSLLGGLGRTVDTTLGSVQAQVELAGDITRFNVEAAVTGVGPAFWLPVKVKLINPLLGNTCYIGSNDDPIVLKPAYTKTATLGIDLEGLNIIKSLDGDLLDDTFAVPAAHGCGLLGSLDGAVNQKVGLPSPAGNNAVTFLDTDAYLMFCNTRVDGETVLGAEACAPALAGQ